MDKLGTVTIIPPAIPESEVIHTLQSSLKTWMTEAHRCTQQMAAPQDVYRRLRQDLNQALHERDMLLSACRAMSDAAVEGLFKPKEYLALLLQTIDKKVRSVLETLTGKR